MTTPTLAAQECDHAPRHRCLHHGAGSPYAHLHVMKYLKEINKDRTRDMRLGE